MAGLRTPPPPARPIPLGAAPPRFRSTDLIVIDKVQYTCRKCVHGSVTLARVDNPELTQTLSREQMIVVRNSRGYRHVRDFFAPELAAARVHAGVSYIRDLSDEEQKHLLWKQAWCLAAIRMREAGDLTYSDDKLEKAIPIIAAEIAANGKLDRHKRKRKRAGRKNGDDIDGPGPKCLREWIAALIGGNMNPLALRDMTRKSGNTDPRLEPEAYAFVARFARRAATPEKPKTASLWRQMSAAISVENKRRAEAIPALPALKVPSEKRLREEIAQIDAFDMMAGRQGVDIARNYFRAVTVGQSDVVRPLQRVEFDEWDVHLSTLAIMSGVWDTLSDAQKKKIETVRLVLCLAIDVATECVVGMSIARTACPENAYRCLEMAVSDKQPYADAVGAVTPWDMGGTMETSSADAGSSFANDVFRVMNVDLGVKFMTTVAGLPWLRAKVERIFRSTDDIFVSLFAGRTFGNVTEKGDYDSEANASLTIDEFAEALVRYAIDHYHNRPHGGLGGETPRSAWLRLTKEFAVDPPPDDHVRRVVFGKRLTPMLGSHGVRVLGIDYQSHELNKLFRQKGNVNVGVRVDLNNLGGISVKIGDAWLDVDGAPELFRVTAKDWIAVWDELQARNAVVNAITREILDDTISHLVEVGRIARARRNIADGPMDDETLARHQKRMNIGASFAAERIASGSAKPVHLLHGALVVGGEGAEDDSGALDDVRAGAVPLPAGKVAPRAPKSKQKNAAPAAQAPAARPGRNRNIRWKIED